MIEPAQDRADAGLVIVALNWLAASVPFASDAAPGFLTGAALVIAGFGLGLAWIAQQISTEWVNPQGSGIRRGFARRFAVPLIVAAGFGLLLTEYDLAVRVFLSERELTDFVRAVPQEGRDPLASEHVEKSVGLFFVDEMQAGDGAVALCTARAGLDDFGVLYLPPGSAPPLRIRVEEHLYGPWYRFRRKF